MDYYNGLPLLPHAWLYIAIDARDLAICKVGLTTMEDPSMRVGGRSTENPYYCLFNAYNLGKIGISHKELRDFESYMHRKFADRINFIGTGTASEWLNVSPFDAENQIEHYIANAFSSTVFSKLGVRLMDEDGEVVQEVMSQYVDKYRPHPGVVERYCYRNEIRPYLQYLCGYHRIQFSYY